MTPSECLASRQRLAFGQSQLPFLPGCLFLQVLLAPHFPLLLEFRHAGCWFLYRLQFYNLEMLFNLCWLLQMLFL